MENKRICCFCSQDDAKYTCPRCSVPYCSKLCYQSPAHINCSEEFYQQCVQDELQLENVNNDQKKYMLDILKKFQDEDDDVDSDDDSIPDLSERLQNVDLDDSDEVWNCLSEQERQEFQAILQSGDIGRLIPHYEPWWNKRYESKIVELDSLASVKKDYESLCPVIAEIVPFSTLSNAEPSPCILWNMVNVLAAYVFTVRRYIGEHSSSEGADTILKICTNLNSNQNFDDFATAVDSVIYHANNHVDISCTSEEGTLIHEDVKKILRGPEDDAMTYYILAALSDLRQLFSEVTKITKGVQASSKEFSRKFVHPTVKIPKLKSQNCARKLFFYTSWVNEHYKLKFQSICDSL